MGSNEQEVTGEPISRDIAAEEGRLFFFTGKPCLRGHTVRRYVSTGACVRCLKQARVSKMAFLQAKRMQRGATKTWAFFEIEPAQMATAIAMLRMLGATVKEPVTPQPKALFVVPLTRDQKPELQKPGLEGEVIDPGPWGDEFAWALPKTPPPPIPIPPAGAAPDGPFVLPAPIKP